jgi:hypothetical protein
MNSTSLASSMPLLESLREEEGQGAGVRLVRSTVMIGVCWVLLG